MERYDSYKDSGVEWIGEIPISWNKTKLKYKLQEVVTGGTPDTSNDSYWGDEEKGINWISISDITSNGREITETKKFISEKGLESKKLQILPVNTLIYSIYGSIGKISRLGIPSTIHQGILGLKTDSTYNSRFLEYYLIYFKEYVSLFSSSNTQENLNQEKVSNFDVPVPPLSEQQQIVSFLDTKTSLIDSLIEKTQRKIELIKEKRTSLINEVVTKGLNPNVEMKDSGVEWIGDIPSHWERVKLKYVCSVTTGGKDTQDKVEDGLYPFYVRSPKIERINSYSFEGESVLTVGDGVGVGKVFHYVDGKFEFHQRVYKFSDFKRLTGKFFYWFIKHHFIFVTEDQNSKSTVDSLRRPLIDEFPFVNPPLSEQQQIVEYLDEQTQLIDKTISIEEKRIELLKEYRQSLISEVVTGKRKVV
jgi:type I restriction enzyme S subunit